MSYNEPFGIFLLRKVFDEASGNQFFRYALAGLIFHVQHHVVHRVSGDEWPISVLIISKGEKKRGTEEYTNLGDFGFDTHTKLL